MKNLAPSIGAGDEAEREALESIFRYAISADLDREYLHELIVDQLGPLTREALMTAADRLIEQGREQGLEQGLEQGREQGLEIGLRRFFEQLLTLRFGPLTDDRLQVVRELPFAQVEALHAELASPDFEATDSETFFAALESAPAE